MVGWWCFFFQAEDGIRDAQESRGLGDVYKRQPVLFTGFTGIGSVHYTEDQAGLADFSHFSGHSVLVFWTCEILVSPFTTPVLQAQFIGLFHTYCSPHRQNLNISLMHCTFH